MFAWLSLPEVIVTVELTVRLAGNWKGAGSSAVDSKIAVGVVLQVVVGRGAVVGDGAAAIECWGSGDCLPSLELQVPAALDGEDPSTTCPP